jgi:predicted neutral ceramidase superfamily lipid hydrolase
VPLPSPLSCLSAVILSILFFRGLCRSRYPLLAAVILSILSAVVVAVAVILSIRRYPVHPVLPLPLP